jgi:hypothetical protein
VPAPAWGRSSQRPSRFSPTAVLKQQHASTLRALVVHRDAYSHPGRGLTTALAVLLHTRRCIGRQ